ncbi:MAG: hypothetical protein II934_02950 [Prevotella sp.]|nr:hypothetical protein [Prevotella sp.]MBQ9623389.1 hypothetical protein [Treponema sp.]
MKKYLLFLTFFVLLANVCYSQDDLSSIFKVIEDTVAQEEIDSLMALVKPKYKWMGSEGKIVADSMKLKYRKPKRFGQIGITECFDNYPKLKSTFTCMGNQLHSNDEQFISFMNFVYFAEYHRKLYYLSHKRKETVDEQPYWQRLGILRDYYGDEIGESWVDSVTVYSTEEARKKWNADSAFIFNLHLRPEDYYKKDFKHVKILMIQKKGQGYAYITSFYTDKAKEKFDKYWRRIEKTLRFEE